MNKKKERFDGEVEIEWYVGGATHGWVNVTYPAVFTDRPYRQGETFYWRDGMSWWGRLWTVERSFEEVRVKVYAAAERAVRRLAENREHLATGLERCSVDDNPYLAAALREVNEIAPA